MSIQFDSFADDVTRAFVAALSDLAQRGALVGVWSRITEGNIEAVGPFGVCRADAAVLANRGVDEAARVVAYRWLLLRDEEPLASAELQAHDLSLLTLNDGPQVPQTLDAFRAAERLSEECVVRFLVVPELGQSMVWLAGDQHRFVSVSPLPDNVPAGSVMDEQTLSGRAAMSAAAARGPANGAPLPNVFRGTSLTAVAAAAEPRTKVLNFLIQAQQQSLWCWAACAASIYVFFTNDTVTWPQCTIIGKVYSLTTCCENPPTCNRTGNPATALLTVNCWHLTLNRAADQGETEGYIDAGTPPAVGIQWTGGGGHVVVIYGYTQSGGPNDVIYIADPWPANGYSAMNFNQFPASYSGGGNWVMTVLTQSP